MESFEEALFKEFPSPSEEFLKALFNRMSNGKRMTRERRETLLELINPFSIKLAYDKLLEAEIASGNSGIITTDEEKKAFHYIHSLFLNVRGIDASRISHRDQKTKLSIVVDGNIRKTICSLKFTKSGIRMDIGGLVHELDRIEDVVKQSKELKAVARQYLSDD